MTYLNYTPHTINLNDGRSFPSVGLARVSSSFSPIVDDVCGVLYGVVTGLPDPQDGVKIIVSAMIINANADDRDDLVAPATGHPDTIRNDKGHIVSVPCFVR